MLPRSFFRVTLTRRTKLARRLLERCGRGVVTGVMLGSYLLVLFGLPLPGPQAGGNISGQPYPCQDGNCGCGSAEQCWRRCCCFTDQQKLAWAKQHDVTPPAHFLERFTASELAEMVPPGPSCCASIKSGRGPRTPASVAPFVCVCRRRCKSCGLL